MKFCPHCAHPIRVGIPENDNLPRFICTNCHSVHYQNPKIVVCTIPVWQNGSDISILLCKRAIEPRYDYWTLPGGFMENGETTKEAAFRETQEEAGAHVEVGDLFSLMNLPTAKQVHLFYMAHLTKPIFAPGIESLEVQLFHKNEIPWDQLSFTTVKQALELFFAEPNQGQKGKPHGFHPLDLQYLIYPSS